jgi:mycofactocin precursor
MVPDAAGARSRRPSLWDSFVVPDEGQETAMSEPQVQPQAEPEPEASPEQPAADELLDDELLVEEVSIDGMCGVY